MGLGRTSIAVAVGFGLPLLGVAAPAEAATSSTTTTQCQGLLTCVVPIVTGVTSTLPTVLSTVPQVVSTVPTIVNSVPTVLSSLLTKQPVTTPPKGHKPPAKPAHHGKPVVKKGHHQVSPVTAAATRTSALFTSPPPIEAQPTIIPKAQPDDSNPVTQVIQQVARAAQQVVTLFGWNLLALIPMTGIAVAIARRMSTARRSVSGLL